MRTTFIIAIVLFSSACHRRSSVEPTPIPAPGASTFTLSGRVMENEIPTKPIPGATIAIGDGPNTGRTTTADETGNYRMTDLLPSGFTTTASAEGHAAQSLGVTLTADRTLSFSLARTRSRVAPTTFDLSGTAIDGEGKPLVNGIVYLDFLVSDAPSTYFSHATGVTDGNGAYRVVFDAVPGLMAHHAAAFACLRPPDWNTYASDCQWVTATAKDIVQNFHPYALKKLTAGESTMVNVSPRDSVCVNNAQDSPGIEPDYVCRTTRVVAAADGLMTVEALAIDGGGRPPLEVEVVNGNGRCCLERIENPTSLSVTAGTEVMANVEILWGSTEARSFVLTTTLVQQ